MSISQKSVGTGANAINVQPMPELLPALTSGVRKSARSAGVLHSPEFIKIILERECARSERSNSKFCLVVIDPGTSMLAREQLTELLLSDVRQTDEVGQFDARRLCAFLPYTDPEGAEKFMSRFRRQAIDLGWNPINQLFAYPTKNHDDNEPPRKIDGGRVDDGRDDDGRNDNGRSNPSGKSRRKVKAMGMERLLVRRSPTWKRSVDIVASGAALAMLWPVMLLTAVAIKLTSKGPVLFCQQRSGLGSRPFRIYKFRTMVPGADGLKQALMAQNEQDGPAFKMKSDPRVTRIGRLLRKTSLDELPQLFNILKGDMSLVGPRPLPIAEASACNTWQKRRLDVVPGLTCTWQISGRGTVSFADWARMDRQYIQRRSFIHDVKLVLLTIPAVFSRRGAM